jgi:Domain of unknown function (4846)
MKLNLLMTIFLPVLTSCQPVANRPVNTAASNNFSIPVNIHKTGDIPLPEGYVRINGTDSLFARWLRTISIKNDKRVYLYNGDLKRNQSAQYAVLDIPVGKKDLQQCADAVMRLRAEYLYSRGRLRDIFFADNSGKLYICPAQANRTEFDAYLERVFSYCGTLSLEKQLTRVMDFTVIQPGDVLIKGGSPGHAVIVMDVAENKEGKRIYLLAQSYMPAQDIHILLNPANGDNNPWYTAYEGNRLIFTPEYVFWSRNLRRWQ